MEEFDKQTNQEAPAENANNNLINNSQEQLDPEQSAPDIIPFSKYEINRLRHPREKFWYRFAVTMNIIIAIILLCIMLADVYKYADRFDGTASVTQVLSDATEDAGDEQTYMFVWIIIAGVIIGREFLYAQVRASAVKVTPLQFPEIYHMSVDFSKKLGLKRVPDVFIVQENGILNAFAAAVFQRRFVQINVDLLEIAYRQYKDVDSIAFVLGHEMAHVKLKHVNIGYHYTTLFSDYVPVVGTTLSRAREYSCDRIAQAVSGVDGVKAMMAMTSGKHLYQHTNINDYLKTSNDAGGFWIWIVNLMSSHPILPKRLRALIVTERPGRLF